MSFEPILAAAWARASADAGWKEKSRTLRMWDEVELQNMPALFQALEAVTPQHLGSGSDTSWTLRLSYSIYVSTGSEEKRDPDPSSQEILVDRIALVVAAFAPSRGYDTQDLGGLVNSARIDGDVEIFEGTLGPIAVAFVPVTIVTG